MPASVVVTNLPQFVHDIGSDLDVSADELRRRLGTAAARTLMRAPPGIVPTGWYLTGLQRRSYGYRIAGSRVQITNTASNRGVAYPAINERRYRVALNVLRRRIDRLTKELSRG